MHLQAGQYIKYLGIKSVHFKCLELYDGGGP